MVPIRAGEQAQAAAAIMRARSVCGISNHGSSLFELILWPSGQVPCCQMSAQKVQIAYTNFHFKLSTVQPKRAIPHDSRH